MPVAFKVTDRHTECLIKASLPFVFLLAACVPLPPGDLLPVWRPPVVPEDNCNAAQYGTLVGQDATALERVPLPNQVRVLPPGMAVAQGFSPTRINFELDGDNRIARIFCG